MSKINVKLPSRLDTITAIFNIGLGKLDLSNSSECHLHFTECSFGTPLPMLLLGREILALVRKFPHVDFKFWTRDGNFQGYADHVGFFRFCGIARGNPVGAVDGTGNYQPIQIMKLNQLREDAGEEPYANIAQERATALATVLSQNAGDDCHQALQYVLREIIRNAMEHSRAEFLVYFAQHWKNLDKAEVVLFDTGIGVHGSFKEKPEFADASDVEALNMAMTPGLTCATEAEIAAQHPDARNSGFGLYLSSRICSDNGGRLRLMSGSRTATVTAGNLTHNDWGFDGTCVEMSLKPSKLINFKERFETYIKDGEKLSPKGSKASSFSKMMTI
ncbi:hypothetical protein FHS72_000504 [Loktanella ponticola]|uniref:Uncharacterized protein n=1 Tax=Yoonia ponticola TaxID=1524255 RepID=A0A7W9BI49_9RHOB|nr:ATP-binding protein [Yoonia ponticola]MBB5720900.1 hypothetical protein [Yoonia ponticola]